MAIVTLPTGVRTAQRAIGLLVCEICGLESPLTGTTGLRSQGRRFCREHDHVEGCRVSAVLGGGTVISLS